ncbi:hypothetical protein D3C76_1722970 [compost metagenome]
MDHCHALSDLINALFQLCAHLWVDCPDAELERGMGGNHIGRVPSVQGADGNDRSFGCGNAA